MKLDFGTQMIFFSPEGFRCVTWSPIGCSSCSGCLLAVITTHYYVAIYGPKIGSYPKQWVEIVNLSQLLIENLSDDDIQLKNKDDTFEKASDEMLSTSIAWTSQCFPSGRDPFSIIAVGSKAGTITLWRSYKNNIELIHKFKAHGTWVVSMSWSLWIELDACTYAINLVTGCVDGSVNLWKILFSLPISNEESDSDSINTIKVSFELQKPLLTADSLNDNVDRLAFARGNKLYVLNAPSPFLLNIDKCICLENSFSLSMSITGMIWNYNTSQLRVFSVDGKHWTFDISEDSVSINQDVTDSVSQMVDDICLDQINNDEVLDQDEKEAEEDEDVGERKPLFYGVDASANVREKSPVYRFWDILEYSDAERQYNDQDSFFNCLLKACNDVYNDASGKSTILEEKHFQFKPVYLYETNKLVDAISQNWRNGLYIDVSLNARRINTYLYSSIEKISEIQDYITVFEKSLIRQVLSTMETCIQNGIGIENKQDQLFILNLCDRALLRYKEDLTLVALTDVAYTYLSRMDDWDVREERNLLHASDSLVDTDKLKLSMREPCRICGNNILFFLIKQHSLAF
ncbi:598_t:CDS:10 [Ambispora gerdemannii]|uniref:598_t:CDS:1 n=1 Tax=Ambispora gerdemannii TaxID=144530 RepID=A0A9N8VVG3_9GLOM|nr:598_t:CDS:10 [Ambispora gerdemannii]